MDRPPVNIYSLKDPRQYDQERDFWRMRSGEERLSAVEVLRRQFGMFSKGDRYDGSARLRRVLRILHKHGVEYIVVGGYAFAFHAHPRYTGDMDVFVRASEDNAQRIIKALHDFGFTLPSLTWRDFTADGKVVQLGYPPLRIDIMTSIDGVTFDEAWSRKIESRYGDQPIGLLSREDLIRNKQACGRKQDLLDLESLA